MKMTFLGLLLAGSALLASASIFTSVDGSNVTSIDVSVDLQDIETVVSGTEEIADMASVFQRSEEEHQKSMDALMKNMSGATALNILRKENKTDAALISIAEEAMGVQGKRLRKGSKAGALQPRESGADRARKMLNEMIGESMEKYDLEIAKCTNYYSKQCGAMNSCRGEISAANYKAAHSRELILAAQTQISISEKNLPTLTEELIQHKKKCKLEIAGLKERLVIVMGDISILTMILKMTDCDAKKGLIQQKLNAMLLKCKSTCTKRPFISFDDKSLAEQLDKLQSKQARKLLTETLGDLVPDNGPRAVFIQGEVYLEQPKGGAAKVPKAGEMGNKSLAAKPNLPPPPRVETAATMPCSDPDAGAPSAADKAAAKCTLGKGQCYKLQERFMLIQSGIMDERDTVQESLKTLEDHCEELDETLSTDIGNEETILKEEGTKLATATTEESNAGEKARQVSKQHGELAADLKKMMDTCTKNYIAFESEQCALKKIRGELAKLEGAGANYQDCKLSKWEPGECSKPCAGGITMLTRKVMTQPDKGCACLPLESERRCNDFPCPINCKLEAWSGWSRCSAECGGGVTQRLRDITRQMMHNGEPCGETSEAKACNVQACEADCVLTEWTTWGPCTKECDSGTSKRQKFVKEKALGEGKCAGLWDPTRLEYKACNSHVCTKNMTATVQCNATLDVVLMLDGSGSLGNTGWEASKAFSKMLVDAMSTANIHFAMLTFSGPRTWGGVSKCMGEADPPPPGVKEEPLDLEKTCMMKWVQHFEKLDPLKTKKSIDAMEFPKGGTLTSLALGTVASEFTTGRPDAATVVIVVTDGRPLSMKRTMDASRAIRKQARLMWVPVTKFAPLKDIKGWASRRWQENVVTVEGFDKLATVATVDFLTADMCHNLVGAQEADSMAVVGKEGKE